MQARSCGMLGVCLLTTLGLLVPLPEFVLLVDRAGSAGGQVTARGHGSAGHLPCPDQDKCSFECQTETGQEMASAGGCKHNGQGEHTPSDGGI